MSPWPRLDPELRAAWSDPTLSTAEIGERLGITPRSAIGRARRIGLPPRTGRVYSYRGPMTPRAKTAAPKPARAPVKRQKGTGELLGPTLKVVKVKPPVTPSGPVRACCWPLWRDGEPSGGVNARFCSEPTVPSGSWCARHHAIAYVPRKLFEIADAA